MTRAFLASVHSEFTNTKGVVVLAQFFACGGWCCDVGNGNRLKLGVSFCQSSFLLVLVSNPEGVDVILIFLHHCFTRKIAGAILHSL